jgi:hypothetical protein
VRLRHCRFYAGMSEAEATAHAAPSWAISWPHAGRHWRRATAPWPSARSGEPGPHG